MTRRRPPVRAKKDANHNEIASAFRSLGWSVVDMSNVGNGVPDLCVGGYHPGEGRKVTVWVEVKTQKGKLRECQDAFAQSWRGRPMEVARTVDDVMRITGQGATNG